MKKIIPQLFTLAAAAMVAMPAFSQTVGLSSVDPLRIAYAAAEVVRGAGAVEAKAVEIDQVRWDRVVFRNDSGRRLMHVQLWTKAASYAELKARLANSHDPLWDLLGDAGVQKASAGGQELVICNHGASGVVLSFDRSMAAPSQVQIAAAPSDSDAAG